MERRNKIILYSIIVLTVVVLSLCINSLVKNKSHAISDASIFRQEYMSYNDKVDSQDNAYLDVMISEDNLVNYITLEEAINMLKSQSGIIYFGYATNKECRALIPTLLKVSNELKEPIYYLDISLLRPTYEVIDGNVKKIKEENDLYYELIDLLKDYLDEYAIYDALGNRYVLEEKWLSAPTLVAFKDGNITSAFTNYHSELENEDKLESLIESLIKSKNTFEDCARHGC